MNNIIFTTSIMLKNLNLVNTSRKLQAVLDLKINDQDLLIEANHFNNKDGTSVYVSGEERERERFMLTTAK